jgi:hypothetical protein
MERPSLRIRIPQIDSTGEVVRSLRPSPRRTSPRAQPAAFVPPAKMLPLVRKKEYTGVNPEDAEVGTRYIFTDYDGKEFTGEVVEKRIYPKEATLLFIKRDDSKSTRLEFPVFELTEHELRYQPDYHYPSVKKLGGGRKRRSRSRKSRKSRSRKH